MQQQALQKAGKFIAAFLLLSPITYAAEPIVLDLRHELESGSPFPAHKRSLIKRQQLVNTYIDFVPTHNEFYVNMAVGSPAQQIKFAVTVLENTWLPGPPPSEKYCDEEKTTVPEYTYCYQLQNSGWFDPSKSKSFKNETKIKTFNASVSYAYGYYGIDNWTLGQTNMKDITFGIASNFSYSPSLGLGVYPSFGKNQVETLPQALQRQKLVDLVAYGVYLNDWRANTGQLTIGSVDISKYEGRLKTFPPGLLNTLVPLQGLELMEGKTRTTLAPKKSYTATMQLGNSGLYLPDDVMAAVAKKYNGVWDLSWGGYLCKCSEGNTDDKLNWKFDGIDITSPIDQLIIPAIAKNGTAWKLPGTNENACELRMASSAPFAPIDFGLGTPFLRAAYVVFDFTNNQTSVAQANINVTRQNLVPIADSLTSFDPKADSDNVATMSIPIPSFARTGAAQSTNGASQGGNNDDKGGGGGSSNIGAIVGGVVGGVGGIALIVGAILFFRHQRKKKGAQSATGGQQYQPVAPANGQGSNAPEVAAVGMGTNEYKGYDQAAPPRPISELASPLSPPPPHSPPPGQYGQQQNWGNQQQYQQYQQQNQYPQVPQPHQPAPQYQPPTEMP